MAGGEHRQIARDSLFQLAELRLDGVAGEAKVRVRNLSAGGMMAETQTPLRVERGQSLTAKIRNHGWVEGTVAWVEGARFGIAFARDIDPAAAKQPAADADAETPKYLVRRPLGLINRAPEPGALRKV